MGYLKKLADDVAACAAEGIITGEQAALVVRRAEERRSSRFFNGTTIIAGFAGISMILGISLIVSSNWDRITPLTKVLVFLALYALAGEGAQRAANKIGRIVLQVLWFALPIAGIGLYGQVFQLSGDPIKPLLVWAALSLPLAFFCETGIIPILETILIFSALVCGLFCSGLLNFHEASGQAAHLTAWLVSGALLAAAWTVVRVRLPRFTVWAGIATLGWFALYMGTMRHSYEWRMISAVLCAGAAMLAFLSASAAEEAKSKLPLLIILAVVYSYSFKDRPFHHFIFDGSVTPLLLPGLVYSAGLLTIFLAKARLLPETSAPEWVARGILLGAVLLPLPDCFGFGLFAVLAGNLLMLAAGIGLIRYGGEHGSPRCINYGMGVVVLVLLTRFVDLLGSLFVSGLGFLAFGLLLAGFAWLANKQRKSLIARAVKEVK